MINVDELNNAVSVIAQRTVKQQNKRIPELYTVIVDSIDEQITEDSSECKATVHFAGSDIQMTLPVLSGYKPIVGKKAYVITLGGSTMTGSFIFASPNPPFIEYDTINNLQSQVNVLAERIDALEGKI